MASRPAFDINRKRDGADKAAMLPTLGTRMNDALPRAMDMHVDGVDSYLAAMHLAIEDASSIAKSGFEEAAKALGAAPPQAFSYSTMSFMPDPANYGLMQWPGLNPESLRKICRDNITPIVIIRQRCDDIARYANLSSHIYVPGWHVGMREASETPTKQDRDDMKEAERFILNCSMEGGKDPRDRDANLISPFEMYLRGFVDDSLTFDGWATWTDMNSAGQVRAFANIPAGMVRLALPTRGYKGNRNYFAALVDETGSPVKPFTRKELTWRIRNVRNDPSVVGYGWPEPEQAVRLIQAMQNAIDLNADTFTRSSIPNGMMVLKGDFWNQEQVDAIMREWTNMKRGVSKMWGLPVLSIPDKDGDVELMSFMDMKGQEVRYRDHMNMMMGLACLVWRFPIRRLGMFVSGHGRDNQPVQDAAIEIQGADDPGLPPLLSFVENTINPYILWSRWPRLQFRFMSKDPKSDARAYEARKMARTWMESRAEADLPPLPSLVKAELRPLAEIMQLAPDDPNKASAFQTVATKLVELMYGSDDAEGSGGGDPPNPGNRMTSKKDPAESQGHGHLSGTKRNSRAEKNRAAANTGAIT